MCDPSSIILDAPTGTPAVTCFLKSLDPGVCRGGTAACPGMEVPAQMSATSLRLASVLPSTYR